MGTLSITLIGLLLPVKLYCSESCMQMTNHCPSTKELWEKRTEEFICWARDTSYSCLLNAENQLVETCIYEVKVEKGVVGCPYVTLCLEGFPQVGTEDKYTECPKNIPGCPDKDHETYTLYELYKYPSCFSANKSELLYTTGTTPPHTTSRIFGNEHKTTEENSFALQIIISGIIVVITIAAIAAVILIKRGRKHPQKHMHLHNSFEEKSLLSVPVIPSPIHMEYIGDGLLEMTWQPPSDNSEVDSYYIYRKREDKSELQMFCEVEMTNIQVLTNDVPEWEGFFYGVAANCSQMTGQITWTERPVSEQVLRAARLTITSVRVEFIVDGVLEVIWEVLSGITDIEHYFILRQKVNTNDLELLDRRVSTRNVIFTTDSPTWEYYFYGVAAKRFGRKESITWTTCPVSEDMLKGKATAVGPLYKSNMPEGSNENDVLLETKRLTKSSMSIHSRHQDFSEQESQGPRQPYLTMLRPKASEVLNL